jgi:hypothetical protein
MSLTVSLLRMHRAASVAFRRAVTAALCLLPLVSAPSLAQTALAPPCGTSAKPAYSKPGDEPHLLIVRQHPSMARWAPPSCTGWGTDGFRMLLALAGSFRFEGTGEDLLARFGSISSLRTIKYWSQKHQRWTLLINDATALQTSDPESRRPDFMPAEMRSTRPFYFLQDDDRSFGPVVYRMEVLQRGVQRLVVTVENVSPIRAFLITWLRPGELQSIYFFDRERPGIWTLYTLWRTGTGAKALSSEHEAFASRAIAYYRHLAGIPTDVSPPVLQASR